MHKIAIELRFFRLQKWAIKNITKMQRYHSDEDTDKSTTSATEPDTAMSETTSNIDVNELILTEV